MKITLEKEPFLKALGAANAIASERAQVTALRCVHLKSHGEEMLVRAASNDVFLNYKVPAQNIHSGERVLPAALLYRMVNQAQGESIHLQSDDFTHVFLSTDAGKFKIFGESPELFPNEHAVDECVISVNAKRLSEMIRLVSFAASEEVGRYSVNGVCIYVRDGHLECAATDGYVCGIAKTRVDGEPLSEGLIIPLSMARLIGDVLDVDGEANIAVRGKRITLSVPHASITAATVDLPFPKVWKAIPTKLDIEASIDRPKLLNLIQSAKLMMDEEAVLKVRLSIGKIAIHSESATRGIADLEMDVGTGYAGDPHEFRIRAKYLEKVLRGMKGDLIQFCVDKGREKLLLTGSPDEKYVIQYLSEKNT